MKIDCDHIGYEVSWEDSLLDVVDNFIHRVFQRTVYDKVPRCRNFNIDNVYMYMLYMSPLPYTGCIQSVNHSSRPACLCCVLLYTCSCY